MAKKFDLPLNIAYSNIGKMEIKIPWTKRLKEPTEAYLTDLVMILEPANSMDELDIIAIRAKFLDSLAEECRNKIEQLNKDN